MERRGKQKRGKRREIKRKKEIEFRYSRFLQITIGISIIDKNSNFTAFNYSYSQQLNSR